MHISLVEQYLELLEVQLAISVCVNATYLLQQLLPGHDTVQSVLDVLHAEEAVAVRVERVEGVLGAVRALQQLPRRGGREELGEGDAALVREVHAFGNVMDVELGGCLGLAQGRFHLRHGHLARVICVCRQESPAQGLQLLAMDVGERRHARQGALLQLAALCELPHAQHVLLLDQTALALAALRPHLKALEPRALQRVHGCEPRLRVWVEQTCEQLLRLLGQHAPPHLAGESVGRRLAAIILPARGEADHCRVHRGAHREDVRGDAIGTRKEHLGSDVAVGADGPSEEPLLLTLLARCRKLG
mmetsp:Transcript_90045/g.291403  ORF Transcript_90045/g.291403 Transcript_90045/m.291403 type:complete len:303 (-) Transcript_90045:935-1843(-)